MNELERLIKAYEDAIARSDDQAMMQLALAIEQEADRIGYENHGRLIDLHTRAEQAMHPTGYHDDL